MRTSGKGPREGPEVSLNGENQLPYLAASTVMLTKVGLSWREEPALGKACRTNVIMSRCSHFHLRFLTRLPS